MSAQLTAVCFVRVILAESERECVGSIYHLGKGRQADVMRFTYSNRLKVIKKDKHHA